jgi:hypothetical protein
MQGTSMIVRRLLVREDKSSNAIRLPWNDDDPSQKNLFQGVGR